MRNIRPLLIIIAVMLILTVGSVFVSYLNASSSGDETTVDPDEPVDTVEPQQDGFFHCAIEIRDDLHQVDAFFGIVETFPTVGKAEWPVIQTKSHTAETIGYTLIQIRGISVPSQFADRTRPLIEVKRERDRFAKAMKYTWALLSQSETLILRNPEPTKEGVVRCDVFLNLGGQELDISKMLIADGHARPTGNWNWGARDVYEVN